MFYKVKALVSYALVLSIAMSLFATPAFAATSCDQDISFMVSDGESDETIDLSKCTLLLSDTLTLITNDDGKVVDVFEGDMPSACGSITADASQRTVTVNFYKLGNTYYVELAAKAKPDRWWIEELELSFLPKGFPDWDVTKRTPTEKRNTCTILKSFSYSNGAPSNVTVEVKWYIHTAGEYALEDYFGWSKTYTLDNP